MFSSGAMSDVQPAPEALPEPPPAPEPAAAAETSCAGRGRKAPPLRLVVAPRISMKSAWADRDAEAAVARYADAPRDVALRVYTTRLLGADPKLVLHGGGNTSVKTRVADLNGEATDVLCVKGSGWDMATIEPPGLPAVRLEPLRKLRARDALTDEDMVRLQRANLIDPSAPNPSVETLLHAFLPHKFVDHTHSTAVLSLTDQPDGDALCEEVYGTRMGTVPYIMPGFALAKAAAEAFERDTIGRRADPAPPRHLHLRRRTRAKPTSA